MIYLNGTSRVSPSRNKDYLSEVFQTPLAVPHLAKVAGRKLKACKFTKKRLHHGLFYDFFVNFQYLFYRTPEHGCFHLYKITFGRMVAWGCYFTK